MPRVYSYIIAIDNGAAPNVENRLFSLAICKPRIRASIHVGDYLIGIGGNNLKLGTEGKQIIFIVKITKMLTMKEYAEQFPVRVDSIYTKDEKLRPWHKFHGTEKQRKTDLRGKNVILSTDFIFFGKKHVPVPRELKEIIPRSQAHFSNKNAPYVNEIIALFANYKIIHGNGKIGEHNTISTKGCRTSPMPPRC